MNVRKDVIYPAARRLILCGIAAGIAAVGAGCISLNRVEIERSTDAVVVRHGGSSPELTYRLSPPPNSGLPVESGSYFHPFTTPKGVRVTDFAPADHRHHRGLFLAWVEMHGAQDADFWGWGAHAPVKDRRIVNRSVSLRGMGGFTAVNDWMAGGESLIEETLAAESRIDRDLHIVDLTYRFAPKAPLTLSQWAFSGFCLRIRKDGATEYFSPDGLASLPNPSHLKPESDWPDAPWYAGSLTFPEGTVAGAAVINHPSNPPTLWHNHRDIRMINPCIVAPAAVRIEPAHPLVLRYRVVAFDGKVPVDALNKLAANFRK